MKAETGREYAQLFNGKCHRVFTSDDLPEWADVLDEGVDPLYAIHVIDVTGLDVGVGDVFKDGKFIRTAATDQSAFDAHEIARLEALITPRRMREALLSGDHSFIDGVEQQITALRERMQ